MSVKYVYPDGTPMPKEHKEWFDSGPITPEMLNAWLNIIQNTKETK